MSNPQNPLNEFRSYAYYFIIGVAGSTESAERAGTSVAADATTGADDWTLLINGAKNTKLIVKSVRFQSILNSNEEHNKQTFYHTMNLSGEIEIQEPMGINLYEEFRAASEKFGVSTTGLTFFAKPIFVGYKPNKSAEYISNVKPYIFVLTDVTSEINEGGATYHMKTMGVVNGSGKLESYQSVADGFTVMLEEQPLKDGIKHFETKLNSHYAKQLEARKTAATENNMEIKWEDKRECEYKIVLDEAFNDAKYVIGSNNLMEWSRMANKKEIHVVEGSAASIESIINKIMLSCCKIVEERGKKSQGDAKITQKFNVYSSVNSKASDKKKVYVTFYIRPYDMYFLPTESKISPKVTDKLLTFDYIYTGRNIDIRSFVMKLKFAWTEFSQPVTSNSLSQDSNPNKAPIGVGSSCGNPDKGGVTDKGTTSICGGHISSQEARETVNAVGTASYLAQLRRWSGIESQGIQLEIKGNPQLMEETTFIPGDLGEDKPNTYSGETQFSEKGALKSPVQIKVNIKFPKDYTNPRSNFTTFWYDGPYTAIDIDNVFQDGEFYQVLTLYALPSDMHKDTTITEKEDPCSDRSSIVHGAPPIPVGGSTATADAVATYEAAAAKAAAAAGTDAAEATQAVADEAADNVWRVTAGERPEVNADGTVAPAFNASSSTTTESQTVGDSKKEAGLFKHAPEAASGTLPTSINSWANVLGGTAPILEPTIIKIRLYEGARRNDPDDVAP